MNYDFTFYENFGIFFFFVALVYLAKTVFTTKKKSVPVRDFKTFPKVKTFFSFSTPNRLFFIFKHVFFQKHKSNDELIVCIILTKYENHNSFFQKSFVTKIEKMKIFSVSQTKIDFFFLFKHCIFQKHKSNDELIV